MFFNSIFLRNFFEGKIKLWKSFWIAGELIYGFLLLALLQLDKYFFSELSDISILHLQIENHF